MVSIRKRGGRKEEADGGVCGIYRNIYLYIKNCRWNCRDNCRKIVKKEGKFVSLATAQHNAKIEHISYTNKKITKPLFWVGMFLPDFKVSWGMLLVYLFFKYPISLKVRFKCWLREVRTSLYLFGIRRCKK